MASQSQLRRGYTAAKLALAFLSASVAAVPAVGEVIYNSVPNPLPANVASLGPEPYAFQEVGDALVFTAGTQRNLRQITVILSDWACTSGSWFNPIGSSSACVTTPGATFDQPITMNIYSVNPGPTAGTLLTSKTATFTVPYRPSSEADHCGPNGTLDGDGTEWYDPMTNSCNHGIAFPITFDFSREGLLLPDTVIVTVAFNTTHYGPHPIGENAPCYSTIPGCPYDWLNIGAFGKPGVGSVLDPDGIWFTYSNAADSCNPSATATGILLDDSPCLTGYHPEFLVEATPYEAIEIGSAGKPPAAASR